VEPETENHAACSISSFDPFKIHLGSQRRLARQRKGFPKMINTLKHRARLVTAMFMVATPAYSQAPTDAQCNAIPSQCRASYQAHCASVPRAAAGSSPAWPRRATKSRRPAEGVWPQSRGGS